MQKEISLLGSKTFWAALFALVAIVAHNYGLAGAFAFVSDPHNIDLAFQVGSMIGVGLTMVFRSTATAQVTSVLPKGTTGAIALPMLFGSAIAKAVIASCLAISLGACAQLQAEWSTLRGNAAADLLKVNLAIAKAEPTVNAFIVRHITQADGYFQQIAATGVFSDAIVSQEHAAVAEVKALAGNLPTNVAGVAETLAEAFTRIQTLTTVPAK